jgi:hypothetical protein
MRYQTALPLTTPFHHDLIFSLGVAWYVVAVFKLIRLAFG